MMSVRLHHILVCLIGVVVIIYIYMVSTHRIQSYSDVTSAIQIMNKPMVSGRCRAHNITNFNCLPNVLFIGASKCGTTSMVDYLSQHQNVDFIKRRIHNTDKHKEVHRFDRNTYGFAMSAIDFIDEWASTPIVSSEDTTVIHYTPHYLYAPTVPYTVRHFYPYPEQLRFIVMLRDPVDRALSSYWFQNSHLFHKSGDQGSVQEFMELARAEINERSVLTDRITNALQARVAVVNQHLIPVPHRRVYEQCMDRALHAVKAQPNSQQGFRSLLFSTTGSGNGSGGDVVNSGVNSSLYHLHCHISREHMRANRFTPVKATSASSPLGAELDDALKSSFNKHDNAIGSNSSNDNTDMHGNASPTHGINHDDGELYAALVKCYGRSLRSPALGRRHLDKGVYVDQVVRWLDSGFQLHQFLFVSLKDMQSHPEETFQSVLDFMGVVPTVAESEESGGSDGHGGGADPIKYGGGGSVDAVGVGVGVGDGDGEAEHGTSEEHTHRKHHINPYDAVIDKIDFHSRRLRRPNSLTVDISETDRRYLVEYFEPYNEMLFHLLGRNDLF